MTTKHQPAMPLPWTAGEKFANPQDRQDDRYRAHAANAYPRLIETLKGWLESHNNNEYPGGANVRAILTDALLRELGEE